MSTFVGGKYICNECGQDFASPHGLAGHYSHHARSKKRMPTGGYRPTKQSPSPTEAPRRSGRTPATQPVIRGFKSSKHVCDDCGAVFSNPQALGGHRSQHARGNVATNSGSREPQRRSVSSRQARPSAVSSSSLDVALGPPGTASARRRASSILAGTPSKRRRDEGAMEDDSDDEEGEEDPEVVARKLERQNKRLCQQQESLRLELRSLSKMIKRLRSLGVMNQRTRPSLYFSNKPKRRKIIKEAPETSTAGKSSTEPTTSAKKGGPGSDVPVIRSMHLRVHRKPNTAGADKSGGQAVKDGGEAGGVEEKDQDELGSSQSSKKVDNTGQSVETDDWEDIKLNEVVVSVSSVFDCYLHRLIADSTSKAVAEVEEEYKEELGRLRAEVARLETKDGEQGGTQENNNDGAQTDAGEGDDNIKGSGAQAVEEQPKEDLVATA